MQGLQSVLETGRAVVFSLLDAGDDTDDDEQVGAHIILYMKH